MRQRACCPPHPADLSPPSPCVVSNDDDDDDDDGGGGGVLILLRGAILNRSYGTHKHLYISLFLLTIFGPIYYGPP